MAAEHGMKRERNRAVVAACKALPFSKVAPQFGISKRRVAYIYAAAVRRGEVDPSRRRWRVYASRYGRGTWDKDGAPGVRGIPRDDKWQRVLRARRRAELEMRAMRRMPPGIERDQRIAAMRAAGKSSTQIGKCLGLSDSMVRRLWNKRTGENA